MFSSPADAPGKSCKLERKRRSLEVKCEGPSGRGSSFQLLWSIKSDVAVKRANDIARQIHPAGCNRKETFSLQFDVKSLAMDSKSKLAIITFDTH